MTGTSSWQPWVYTLTWQFHGSIHGPHIVSLRATLCTLMALLPAGEAREEGAEMIIIFQLLFGSWHDMEDSTAYIPMAMMIKQELPPMLQYGVVRLAHVNSTIMPTTSVCIIQYTHTATVRWTAQTLQSSFTLHLAIHPVLGLFSETIAYFVSCFRILELEFSCWVEKKHHWKRCAVITQSETVHAGSPEKKRCSMGSSTN